MIHTVDENIKKIAEASAIERIGTEYDRFKLEDQERLNMLIIGCIGELIFEKILQRINIPYESSYDGGEVDNFDFLIDGKIFDAKTSYCDGNYKHLHLLYSKDQYAAGEKKKYNWVIQIFINGRDDDGNFDLELCNKAWIAGAIAFKKIKKYRVKRKHYAIDYEVPLSKLSQFKTIR